MPVLFSDLLKDPAFEITNRRAVKELYDEIKMAVKANKLTLEGHTLPASLNDWIKEVEGDKKLPKRDTDVVDFSVARDKKYEAWRKSYLAGKNPVLMTKEAKQVLEVVQGLAAANVNSLSLMNSTKDDVVAALSDLQAAVYLFMTTYDQVHNRLNLAPRDTPLERVKVGKLRREKTAAPTASAPAKTKVKRQRTPSTPRTGAQPS